MPRHITWIIIEGVGKRKIGAVGLIDNTVAVVVAFYDDKDADYDGNVSVGEWLTATLWGLGVNDYKITEVALAAKYQIFERDPSFAEVADRMFLAYMGGAVASGIYTAYFSRAIGAIASPIAARISGNIVKQYFIREGFENAVKAAYDASLRQLNEQSRPLLKKP